MKIGNWLKNIFNKIKKQGKKDQKTTGDKDAITSQ